ncbi:MAG: anthranilate phosphoribosyltransferase [Alphaproteobacteria bacterium]
MQQLSEKLSQGKHLTSDEITSAFDAIMTGKESIESIANFLQSLAQKGETADEITAAAAVMRKYATTITAPDNAIDIVGTGGDLKGSLNISTATSFVVAGLGFAVAKHGNRAITSQAGTADVQEELGIDINYPLDRVEKGMAEIGFAFLFAQKHHPAMRHVMPARKLLAEKKIKTIFNILGPLTNPAYVKFYLLGVYDKKWLDKMATALKNLNAKTAWVVHGNDGLDELSITGDSQVAKLQNGNITLETITPQMAGLSSHPLETIKGGTPADNAKAIINLFQNKMGDDKHPSLGFHDAVLYNAAAALCIIGAVDNLKDGALMAKTSIADGKALKKLQDFASFTKTTI